jgi:hypothetical protein
VWVPARRRRRPRIPAEPGPRAPEARRGPPAATAPRAAAGQEARPGSAVGARAAPGRAAEATAGAARAAEAPAGAAVRVWALSAEKAGARYGHLSGGGPAATRQGGGAGRVADAPAGIRRARSWAPRVPGDRSTRVADRGEPPSDEHHGPTPTPDADRYHSSIGHVPPRRLPDAAQTPRALLPDGRDALAPALNTLGGRSR